MKADRASAVMRTLNPGEVKPKGIDCSHYDRKICVVRRHVYVPRMKPLLATFAVHGTKDLWFVIAPADHEFRARTFDRMEVRAVAGILDINRPAASDDDAQPNPHHQT